MHIRTQIADELSRHESLAGLLSGGLNADVLAALWEKIDTACRAELADAKQTHPAAVETHTQQGIRRKKYKKINGRGDRI